MSEEKARRESEKAMLLQRYFDFDWAMGGRRRNIIDELLLSDTITTKELSESLTDTQLQRIFKKCNPWSDRNFYGEFYSVVDNSLELHGGWALIEERVWNVIHRHGRVAYAVFCVLLQDKASFSELADQAGEIHGSKVYPSRLISELARKWELVVDIGKKGYSAWIISPEIKPIIHKVLNTCGLQGAPRFSTKIARDEFQQVIQADREFETSLMALLENRLEETLEFGEKMSTQWLTDYLKETFGDILFFDILLALTQQYAMPNIPILNERDQNIMQTGFNLALFGEPGTGKTFAVDDVIRGNTAGNVPPHGLPGLNRYCGGMTAARFIRIGEAYEGRQVNFIVPEFNNWFRYSGMVDVLKLAMEQREIKYEIKDEVVGPYKFSSFFSVNYNTRLSNRGYQVTIADPNFNAIEDRMLCRLSSLDRARFDAISESQRKLLLGDIDLTNEAVKIRDHVTLSYAVQMGHHLVRDKFPSKPVLLKRTILDELAIERKRVLEKHVDVVPFSPRLEARAVKLACAFSLISLFQQEDTQLQVSEQDLQLAKDFFVEECAVRAKGSRT
ncbi:MAG: hypothetical protein ACW976_04680 [Candidatus Ranarchaeia archaeon]|jgi:hypothetical protein